MSIDRLRRRVTLALLGIVALPALAQPLLDELRVAVEHERVGPVQRLRARGMVPDAVAKAALGLERDVRNGELVCAIFGRRVERSARLAEGDRVEITRPLACDPKTARRRRAERNR
jgi:putative ubiquitin-RnfH superfamily antitoxin RatB of RatAB toxin-antitoxin module